MTSCKLLIYLNDDFKLYSGSVESFDPFYVKAQGASEDILKSASAIKIKWYEGKGSRSVYADLLSVDFDRIKLQKSSDVLTGDDNSHFIKFSEYLDLAKVENSDISSLKKRVDKINNRFRGTLVNQIKKIITDETLTNQYLLKMLIQIDGKMDELLDTLKQDFKLQGLKERQLLTLGGDGFSFISEERLTAGESVYIQSLPRNGVGVSFSALSKVTDVIELDNHFVCETSYSYLDEGTRENIIHYIFQKEREKLKRKSS